jgi:hypothetical protein
MVDSVAPLPGQKPAADPAATKKTTTPPPIEKIGILRWLKENLFNSPFNTVLTIIMLFLLADWIPSFLQWGVFDAVWYTADHNVCRQADGACWAVVGEKHRPMLFGVYPYDEHWRLVVALIVYMITITLTLTPRCWSLKILVPLWIVGGGTVALMLWGGVLGLTYVDSSQWGGLPLTMVLFTGSDQGDLRHLDREHARRSLDHHPIRRGQRVPVVPAGRSGNRQAVPRDRGHGDLFRLLPGGSDPRRPTGHSARPI